MAEKKLYDLERLTKFRRNIHKYPELAFEEVKTSNSIIEYLLSIGIEKSQIRRAAKTGIIVDIDGKAPPSGKRYTVALRADMDCLPIKELTDLEYKSVVENCAHMCGHDGHCAWLLGAASRLMEKIDLIPSDKRVRLLFQPAEEELGGALPMIQEGCLDGVDEVYGAHNTPDGPTGYLVVKSGPTMSELTEIRITLIGKGGHGSAPEKAKDPLQAAIDIIVGHREIVASFKAISEKGITSTLPYLHCGEAFNVIHERAEIQGTLRTFDEKVTFEFKSKFQEMCEKVCKNYGVNLDLKLLTTYPVVINTPEETEIVVAIAKEIYGEGKVGDWGLPALGSEDFSFYTRYLPGVFFFPTAGKKGESVNIHEAYYDFDDEAIEKTSELLYRIALHRLDLRA